RDAQSDLGPSGAQVKALQSSVDRLQDQLDGAQEDFETAVKEVGPSSDAASAALDRVTQILKQLEPLKAKLKSVGGKPQALADRIAQQLAKAKPDLIRVVTPVAFGEQNSGYTVLHDEGIVLCDSEQGRVIKTEANASGDTPPS